jgi:hypothetical protein
MNSHLHPPTYTRRVRACAHIVEEFGGTLLESRKHEWNVLRWEKCHNYTLRVRVTEPRWSEHLEPGLEFGTTAFDV